MAHAVAAMDKDRRLHLVDLWHDRGSLDSAVAALFKVHDNHWQREAERNGRVYGWFAASDQLGDGVKALVDTEQRSRHKTNLKMAAKESPPAYLPLRVTEPLDLMAAARRLQASFENETLLLPSEAPWKADLMSEVVQWPAVPSSVRVGALAVLTSNLDQMIPPRLVNDDYRSRAPAMKSWMAQ